MSPEPVNRKKESDKRSGSMDYGIDVSVQDYHYSNESHGSENPRTNKLSSQDNMLIPCWDGLSHLTGWLLVQYMYLSVWCVGVVPVFVVLYILYLLFCVYSGVVIYHK